jgi:hypothetical protein
VQHPLRPKDVDPVAVDDRTTAGTAVVTIKVLVIGGILELPKEIPAVRTETG